MASLFGLSIPEEYGGIGLSMSQECRLAYEFGKTALAYRSVFGTNVGIGSQGVLMGSALKMRSFARRLQHDLAAVRAAFTLPWTNGQTEGHVNRLKFLKRQMDGRASVELPRIRVLGSS